MKTTIDIADGLLRDARKLAAREGITVKALVELGLRRVLAERKVSTTFRLRSASYGGQGLQPGVQDSSWDRLRHMAYEGRGD